MDLLIHATLTVTGAGERMADCDARIKALLVEEVFTGAFEEHHGDAVLAYDFKVQGGIPFPAFAAASQEFPTVTITAEWVNVAAGRRGRALMANGRITDHVEESVALAGADAAHRYVRIAPDGRLELAVALLRRDAQTWAGYVLDHGRDALFHVTCAGEAIELLATDGTPDWAWRWRLAAADATAPAEPVDPPQRIDPAQYAELDALAQGFVADWFWFAAAPAADNAIEADRYARYGVPVHDANLRAARLHRLRAEHAPGQAAVHSTLDPAEVWLPALLERCWAAA